MNIYVGNLALNVTDEDLKSTFGAYGRIASAKVIKDMTSGDSKGFGFIEMPSQTEAMTAIQNLNGKELNGRTIVVNEARPREDKRGGGGGGRRDGGGPRGGSGGGGGRRDGGPRGGGSGGGRRF